MLAEPSAYFLDTYNPVILRFNYSETRELFEVFRLTGNKKVEKFNEKTSLADILDVTTYKPNPNCIYGDFF